MTIQQRMQRVIALALHTTGPNAYRDRIVGVAAVECRDGEPGERFAAFIDSGTPLLLGPGKRKGMPADGLKSAGTQDEVMASLLDFVGDDSLCIAHDLSSVQSFLRRATKDLWEAPLLDTLTIARLSLPDLPSHDPVFLSQLFELQPIEGDSAALQAERLAMLWPFLLEHLRELPVAVLGRVQSLLGGGRKDALPKLLREIAAEADTADGPLMDVFPEKSLPRRRAEKEPEDFHDIDSDLVASLLDPEGKLAEILPTYEYREEQVRMVEAVTRAFNESKHLLIEAGTGIGKSLGYLVPAVLYSLVNDTSVVISTNTKNLQAQLYLKDLPLISQILDADVKTALIKGRRNYLCLKKLFYLLEHASFELERADRLPLARALCWASRTESGDLSEALTGQPGPAAEITARLSSVAEECSGKECSWRKRCFLQRARRRALAADVIVANHAVVFSEMGNPFASPVLPPHHHLIMDEAHNLEDAITNAMSREVSARRLRFVLNRLCRQGKRRKQRGLLPSLEHRLSRQSDQDEARSIAVRKCQVASALVLQTDNLVLPFFETLARLLKQKEEPEAKRIFRDRKLAKYWDPIEDAQRLLLAGLGKLAIEVNELAEVLAEVPEAADDIREFGQELRASALWIREFTEDTQLVLKAQDEDYVYWVEPAPPRDGGARAWGAPVDVGPLMHEHLYSTKQSVVFTSATLTVMGSPDFIKGRLGIDLIPAERLEQLFLGTVFDFENQCMVLVPMFLPEPSDRNRDYAGELGAFLVDLFRFTRGRAMALFTSYEMLRKSASVVTEELEGDSIRVLTQGVSGSRDNITRIFKADVESVLMGTHSFWEGVDISGESLSCLVLARLPFAVFTDPIVSARCEAIEARGENPFLGYSLPQAVIRFRQGFGRLIRHRHDRGVIIIADRRIVTKRYGNWFRGSIPVQVYTCAGPDLVFEAVNEALGQTQDD